MVIIQWMIKVVASLFGQFISIGGLRVVLQ
jgi:hypothetical protein